jgi:ABC-type Fe3+-citrate transport system substrate-binding protein
MIKQNKTKLPFIFAGILMLSLAVAACNNSGDNKEPAKDTTVTEVKPTTPTPPDTTHKDTMEVTPGKVAPVVETKPK